MAPAAFADGGPDGEEVVAVAAALVDRSSAVVVLTGAGISTGSGIPDFRGPQGVWTRNPAAERASNIEFYIADPEVRRSAWRHRLSSGMWGAAPNAGHRALVDLERRGKLHTLVTQNVDGLHHAAGSDPDLVVEVHGTVRDVVCLACEFREDATPTLDRVRAGEEDPDCPRCGGILKSATISFGQPLVAADLDRAFSAAAACDLFLVVGSSLTVHPIADTVVTARRHGAALMIVNGQPTPFDELADVVLRGDISSTLPAVVGGGGQERPRPERAPSPR